MGNAESVNNTPPPSQQRRPPPPQQRRPPPQQRRPPPPQQRRPQQQSNYNQIQQQLNIQQQQLQAQQRHQKRLEDQLKLQNQHQSESNKLLQEYIESQVQTQQQQPQLTNGEQGTYKSSTHQTQKQQQVEDGEYDEYEILGIDKGCSLNELKKAYKKRALQYHPDRGGNKAIFSLIKKSYNKLLAEFEHENQFENKINQEVRKTSYDGNVVSGFQNKHVDKDNFNINKFNTTFNDYRIDDENDGGYGDLMNNKLENVELDKTVNRSSDFSVNSFNQNFNQQKQKATSDKIIEYKEPEALLSADAIGFSELGGGQIGDYSSSQSNLQYTDYKKAHITETTLIDPNEVDYKQYGSVNDLKRDRATVTHTMSSQEQHAYNKRKEEEQYKEQQRKQRMRQRDGVVEQQFNRINTNMLSQ